ncbi:hypothetical protein L873DRAFT_1820976 [Choiromyces venosus 120613-1]|uniref:Uncharacterized protein n=1 Tax=Choiromyces venosus 120613-1 TaxID=1336337 RepID=A0A3N4J1Q8_9PEZI|nr:hypothetical protein L873DRAFT_1820976 [Choiromyces venosus 120613-1]
MPIIQLTKKHYTLHRSFGYLIVRFLYIYLVRRVGDFDTHIILGELLCTNETIYTIVQGRLLWTGRVVMAEVGHIWG